MIPLLGAIPLKAQSIDSPSVANVSQAFGKGGIHKKMKALANLNDAERQQLKSAMQKIKEDPQMVAARQAVKDAQTKEARMEARNAAHQLRHDLLLKADPSLAPILGKIQPGKPVE
jgi:hypothetical protein